MKRNWIETQAVFASELEDLGIEQSIEDRLEPFRFDLNEVVEGVLADLEGAPSAAEALPLDGRALYLFSDGLSEMPCAFAILIEIGLKSVRKVEQQRSSPQAP